MFDPATTAYFDVASYMPGQIRFYEKIMEDFPQLVEFTPSYFGTREVEKAPSSLTRGGGSDAKLICLEVDSLLQPTLGRLS